MITLWIIWIIILINGMVMTVHLVEVAGWEPERMVAEISSWSQAMLFLESYPLQEINLFARYFIFVIGVVNGISSFLLESAVKSMFIISTISMVSYLQTLERKTKAINGFEVQSENSVGIFIHFVFEFEYLFAGSI